MTENVIQFTLKETDALRIIRDIAEDTERVMFLPHAKLRQKQRRIDDSQVLMCLRKGHVVEGPFQDIKGHWRCTLRRLVAGDDVSIVVSFNTSDRLLVIAVF